MENTLKCFWKVRFLIPCFEDCIFLYPRKKGTVSQPVKAWNAVKNFDFSGNYRIIYWNSTACEIKLTHTYGSSDFMSCNMYSLFFPVPILTHSLIPMLTHFCIISYLIFLGPKIQRERLHLYRRCAPSACCPSFTTANAWRNIRVSASSWLQGLKSGVSLYRLAKMVQPFFLQSKTISQRISQWVWDTVNYLRQ